MIVIEDDNIPPTTAQAKDVQRVKDREIQVQNCFQIRQQDSGDQDDAVGRQECVPKVGAGVLMLKGMPLVFRMCDQSEEEGPPLPDEDMLHRG